MSSALAITLAGSAVGTEPDHSTTFRRGRVDPPGVDYLLQGHPCDCRGQCTPRLRLLRPKELPRG